jgi:hypothetical protein
VAMAQDAASADVQSSLSTSATETQPSHAQPQRTMDQRPQDGMDAGVLVALDALVATSPTNIYHPYSPVVSPLVTPGSLSLSIYQLVQIIIILILLFFYFSLMI